MAQVFLYSLAYKFAKIGGMNQGIVPCLTLFASFFNAIVFYLYFKEKLSGSNLIGMAFALGCAICLSVFSAMKKGETVLDESGVE